MESQPQNPEFRNNPENFHPCKLKHGKQHAVLQMKLLTFSPPVTTFVVCSLCQLMLKGSLYCKQYGLVSSLIRVYIVSFHEKIYSEGHLNMCNRGKKQTTFSGQKTPTV